MPVAVLAVVAVLALLSGHLFHIAWVPVVAIIVVRLLAGGRDRRAATARRLPRPRGDNTGPPGAEHQLQPGTQGGGVGIHAEQVDGREQPGELAVPVKIPAMRPRSRVR